MDKFICLYNVIDAVYNSVSFKVECLCLFSFVYLICYKGWYYMNVFLLALIFRGSKSLHKIILYSCTFENCLDVIQEKNKHGFSWFSAIKLQTLTVTLLLFLTLLCWIADGDSLCDLYFLAGILMRYTSLICFTLLLLLWSCRQRKFGRLFRRVLCFKLKAGSFSSVPVLKCQVSFNQS